ncbi:hypothetical protein [Brevundimonas sp.]|uniref:hypothetical protein n=1 Tax=Brevundimonas sp. TaxID=1871086 RepID=UPI002E15FCAB|nr:hypothetical protein [Brevundimonas sp.]
MTTAQKNKPAYRYYASTAVQLGSKTTAGAVPRVSAPVVEELIPNRLKGLGWLASDAADAPARPVARDLIEKVEVVADGLLVELDHASVLEATKHLDDRTRLALDALEPRGDNWLISIKARMVRRGGARIAVGPNGQPAIQKAFIDPALSAALIRAEAWKRQIVSGEVEGLNVVAEREGVTPAYARRMIRLAFLART